jgi:V/A-type H+-transporting ATPase subunit E
MEQGKVQRLRDRIIKDAEEEARNIVAEGEAEAERIADEARGRAAEVTERARGRAESEAREHIRRQISIRELDARKAVLGEKGKLMDQAFEKAMESLRRKDVGGGYALTKSLLLKAIETGDEEIVLSPEDKKGINESFLAGLNKELKSKGLKGKVKVADDTRPMKGGFILRSGRKEINATFESMLAMMRDETELEISDALFKEAR